MPKRGHPATLRPPWKPGESGNPSGRPKRRPITDLYEKQLDQRLPEPVRLKLGLKEGATYGHALAFRQVQMAIMGETPAAKEITDRIEGRAVARLEHAGAEGDSPLRVVVEVIGGNAP